MNEHLKHIQKDIDEMNKNFSFSDKLDDKTDPPSTDPPADDLITDPPVEEDLKTDPPSTDPPEELKTDPPTTKAPDDRDKTIEDLRAELAKKDKAPKTQSPSTDPPITFEDQDFVGDLDLEDLTEDKDKVNKLLNTVYQKGVTESRGMLSGDVMKKFPNLISAVVNLQKAADKFYEDNEDLTPYRKDVGEEFKKQTSENPDKDFDEIISDVALAVRSKFKLPEIQKKTVDRGNPPKLPKKKAKPGKEKDKPKLDPVQSQIDEMNKFMGGK